MKKVFFNFLILLLLLSMNLFSQEKKIKNENGKEISKVAQKFFLRSLEGDFFYFSRELEKDDVILLSFFATWCVPCKYEIPEIEKIITELQNDNLKVFYIHVGKPQKKKNYKKLITKMKNKLSMTQPILLDIYSKVGEKYGALALPTSIIIGKNNMIKYKHVGFKKGDEKELKEKLQEALGNK